MDIVATRLRALGGSVQLITEVGRGTAFTLTVPLTTAVQRVVLVGAGSGRFAIPFRMVREATRLGDDAGATLHQGGFSFRGRPMPYRDLRSAGGGSEATRTAASRHPVLILDVDEPGAAIGVDSLLGQHDVLLERLEAPETLPAWVSGATILGDGAPAFVVDPTALF